MVYQPFNMVGHCLFHFSRKNTFCTFFVAFFSFQHSLLLHITTRAHNRYDCCVKITKKENNPLQMKWLILTLIRRKLSQVLQAAREVLKLLGKRLPLL